MWNFYRKLEDLAQSRSPIMLRIVVAGAIGVFFLVRLGMPKASPRVKEAGLSAAVGGIREQRGLVTFTTLPDGVEWRIFVYPLGSRGSRANDLSRRTDSVRKRSGSDTLWFLVGDEWEWWQIDLPEDDGPGEEQERAR